LNPSPDKSITSENNKPCKQRLFNNDDNNYNNTYSSINSSSIQPNFQLNNSCFMGNNVGFNPNPINNPASNVEVQKRLEELKKRLNNIHNIKK